MDCSLPSSSVHGIFQARVLEWVAIAFINPNTCYRHPSTMPLSFNLAILIDSWWCLMILICISLRTSNRRRQWLPAPVLLPGKSHGRRNLVGYSLWGPCEESDTTERLHFHFSLSCIGKGNGNLLQCSCLENPRDGGAWWAAVYGVTQSRTRLKRLSSSSSSIIGLFYRKWVWSRKPEAEQSTGALFSKRNVCFNLLCMVP